MAFIPPVNAGSPFVYFNSLAALPETAPYWDSAVALVSSFNSAQIATAEERQMDAVAFLQQVAAFQRQGELAFVNNYKEKLEKKIQDMPDEQTQNDLNKIIQLLNQLETNQGFDYKAFTAALNIAVKSEESFKARLEHLLYNINMNDYKKKNNTGILTNVNSEFTNIISLLQNRKAELQTAQDAYETITSNFITDYVKQHENILRQALFDDGLFSAWLLKLTINFRAFLEKQKAYSKLPELAKDYEKKKEYLQKQFNEFTNSKESNLLNFSKEDIKILKDISTNMEFQRLKDLDAENTREYIELPSLNPNKKFSTKTIAFKSNFSSPALSERMNIMTKKFLEVFLQTGGSNMGNDSLGAVLINYDTPNFQDEINTIDIALKDLNAAMTRFSQIRGEREKVLKGNAKMNKEIETALTNLDKLLAEKNDDQHAFIIHDSDKYYYSIEQGYKGMFHQSELKRIGGFGGRTMSILNYIDTMANLAHNFGVENSNLLYFIALNLDPNAAAGQGMAKATLEEIFTYAAGMIMFDDVAIAVKEATKQLTFSSITNIHLYQLQNLYFPSSYILEETAKYLAGCAYDKTNAAVAQISVGENIYAPGYQNLFKPGSKNYKKVDKALQNFITQDAATKWNTVKNSAITSTKVSIHFFLNFQQFISQIPH